MATSGSSVDHPKHYQTDSGLEAIDVIEAFFPDSFHLGNAFKYLARAGKKGDLVEDLEKAIWYIQQYLDTQVRYTLTPMGKACAELAAAGIETVLFGPNSKGVEYRTFNTSFSLRLGDDGEWYNKEQGIKRDTDYVIMLVQQGWGEVVAVEAEETSEPKPGVTYSAEEVDRFRDYRFIDADGDEWWYENGNWYYGYVSEVEGRTDKPYTLCGPYRLKEEND